MKYRIKWILLQHNQKQQQQPQQQQQQPHQQCIPQAMAATATTAAATKLNLMKTDWQIEVFRQRIFGLVFWLFVFVCLIFFLLCLCLCYVRQQVFKVFKAFKNSIFRGGGVRWVHWCLTLLGCIGCCWWCSHEHQVFRCAPHSSNIF